MSSNTPSIHLSLGLSIILLPSDLQSIILVRISSSVILSTFRAHLSLYILTDVTTSGDLYSWYSSLLYLIVHYPLALIGPYIFLSIFFSKALSVDISNFVSLPYISTGFTNVLCSLVLVSWVKTRDLKYLTIPESHLLEFWIRLLAECHDFVTLKAPQRQAHCPRSKVAWREETVSTNVKTVWNLNEVWARCLQ